MIVKRGKKHCVVSKKGKNLGCGSSEAWAKKRLAQVEYFKHAHKSLADDQIAECLNDGSMKVNDQELAEFIVQHKSLFSEIGVEYDEQFIEKGLYDVADDDEETLQNVPNDEAAPVILPEPEEYLDEVLRRVAKADNAQSKCLKYVYLKYRIYYSGKKIYAALQAWNGKKYPEAAALFAEARDGFEAKKNPTEYNCLDAWSKKAEKMGGTPAEDA